MISASKSILASVTFAELAWKLGKTGAQGIKVPVQDVESSERLAAHTGIWAMLCLNGMFLEFRIVAELHLAFHAVVNGRDILGSEKDGVSTIRGMRALPSSAPLRGGAKSATVDVVEVVIASRVEEIQEAHVCGMLGGVHPGKEPVKVAGPGDVVRHGDRG
ncbi:hypothetical protein ColTof3_04762 [Colletotrichum tofieldiae]|nr:hypothetical protein ColTof3_04762 [Colletotrichum tofieldiae]